MEHHDYKRELATLLVAVFTWLATIACTARAAVITFDTGPTTTVVLRPHLWRYIESGFIFDIYGDAPGWGQDGEPGI